jgi:hypothetical protein
MAVSIAESLKSAKRVPSFLKRFYHSANIGDNGTYRQS